MSGRRTGATPRADVVVVGSINLDLVATTDRLPRPGETVIGTDYHEYPGGKGLNQAVAAARSGASVAMIGRVGGDDAGRHLLSLLDDEHIDRAGVRTVSAPTGRALIGVDATAENAIIVVPGANDAVGVDDVAALPPAAALLAQLEVPVETVAAALAAARGQGAVTILNPAPGRHLPAALLALVDVLVPNEHEVELIGGVAVARDAGVGTVIVTLGARGVMVHTDDGARHVPAMTVTPVDTTAAGDAFCGSLAARLGTGATLDEAVDYARAAAALSTTVAGAVPSLPRRADVDAFLDASMRP